LPACWCQRKSKGIAGDTNRQDQGQQIGAEDRTFFFKTRHGQVYGHFHSNELDPAYRGGMVALHIESFANPAGSTNLAFDAAKQIQ
jgi:hypothetical protein